MEKNQYEFFIRIKFVEFCLFEDNFPLSTAIPSSLSSRVPTKLFRKKDPREKGLSPTVQQAPYPIRSVLSFQMQMAFQSLGSLWQTKRFIISFPPPALGDLWILICRWMANDAARTVAAADFARLSIWGFGLLSGENQTLHCTLMI